MLIPARRKRVLLVMGLFILAVSAFALLTSEGASGEETIIVDIEGNGNFTSIQDAIESASDDDTILIMEGEYHENVVVNKPLIIRGERPEDVILNGSGVGNVVRIAPGGNGSRVEDLTITGSNLDQSGSSGILVQAPCTIDDVNIHTTRNGILVQLNSMFREPKDEDNLVSISNCFIWENQWGVNLQSGSFSMVSRNDINNNHYGIQLYQTRRNVVHANTLEGNYLGMRVLLSENNSIQSNRCSYSETNGIGLSNSHNNTLKYNKLYFNNGSGLHIVFSINNSIYATTYLENNGSAIEIENCTTIELSEGSQLYNQRYGLWIRNSSNIVLYGLTLRNCEAGVVLENSTNVTMVNSEFGKNEEAGVWLRNASSVIIKGSEISFNTFGIRVANGSGNVSLHNNTIVDNTEYGLYEDATSLDPVNATLNYWGADSGPRHPASNPRGNGDHISGQVLFDPWLDEEGNVHYLEDGPNVGGSDGSDDDEWENAGIGTVLALTAILVILLAFLGTLIVTILKAS